jgi:hypothetical protein
VKSIHIHIYKVVGMMTLNDSISENEIQAKESALDIAKNHLDNFEKPDCDFIAISFSGNEILKG